MFCKNCGTYYPDGTQGFCTKCGAKLEETVAETVEAQPQEPTYQEPVYQQPVYQQPVYEPVKTVSAGTCLAWGIVALCCCWIPILGLIFCIIARNKNTAFQRENTEKSGQAIAGNVMSIIALVCHIICAVCYVIIFIAAIAEASHYF